MVENQKADKFSLVFSSIYCSAMQSYFYEHFRYDNDDNVEN